jgi:UrcA family protein
MPPAIMLVVTFNRPHSGIYRRVHMSRSSIAKAFTAVAIVGLIAAAAPARADDAQTRSRIVRISGLDLRTAGGQSVLRHRVVLAARQVCGPAEKFGSLGYASYDRCVQQAEQQATIRVNALIAAKTADARFAAN